jgi:NADPH:quinone reductase-like Zn-dependent oxidoreductase
MTASINPSDVKNVAGAMKADRSSSHPGARFSPAWSIRGRPHGSAPRFGARAAIPVHPRRGSHPKFIAVPAASLRRKPAALSFDQAASVGVNYVAAWSGLEAAGLRTRATILLIGASGGVGNAVAQIARRLGARVIGVDQRPPPPEAPIVAIAEKMIIGAKDLPAEARAATGGRGADVVFDLVGGVMFRSAVDCLACGGRLIEIASTSQREVSFDLIDFYHNESRLLGVDTLRHGVTASANILDALTSGFAAGDYEAAPVGETFGLGGAQEATTRSRLAARSGSCCDRRNEGADDTGYLLSLLVAWLWLWPMGWSRSAPRPRR